MAKPSLRFFLAALFSTLAQFSAVSLGMGYTSAAHAGDASQCIVLGDSKKENSRTLTNTCRADVMVFWCHHGTAKGTADTACNPAKSFYRQQKPMKYQEVKSNRFSLPLGAEVSYGACFGSYGSFSLLDNTGAYYCHPERVGPASKNQTVMITMSGQDQDELCAEITESARTYGRPGECACQTFGPGRAFCRMEVTNAKIDKQGLISQLRAKVREWAACDQAKDPDCKPRPSRTVGIGVRQ